MNRTIQERYEAWLEKNPQAFPLFEQFAMEAARSGSRVGVKAIAERVRWRVNIELYGVDKYKINNDFTSRIARDLIEKHPSLGRVIETRGLKSA